MEGCEVRLTGLPGPEMVANTLGKACLYVVGKSDCVDCGKGT